ncbi:hypothetical protein ACFXHA_13550 [Nocardia sp. NPDC059240]|uniref:hypothetical protein n=1 Tax=Nocardia sp. NPDC059240 TaxID=3346786 RepID=UPI00367FCD2B
MVRHPTPLLLVLTAAAATACASSPHPPAAEIYQGRWNYDLPDVATMTNIATMNIGDGVQGPQIGDIVFTPAGPDRITGRTDVGCTWQFAVTPTGLELATPNQTCHNPTAGYTYTMTAWTVHVTGGHETESIKAISHHRDRDYEFDLTRGARTRAPEEDPKSAGEFQGTWTYGSPDPRTGANTSLTPGAAPTLLNGSVTITTSVGPRLTAHTDNGCDWSLIARGNTAKLDPPIQTCTLADSAVTLTAWTIATDGHHQLSSISGTAPTGTPFTATGDLTRR